MDLEGKVNLSRRNGELAQKMSGRGRQLTLFKSGPSH